MPKQPEQPAQSPRTWRPMAFWTAILLGASEDRRAVGPLLAALGDKAQDRPEIAIALGSLADPRAVEPLAGCLAEGEDKDLRAAAAWALGHIGPPAAQAVPALEKALADQEETVRKTAAEALQKIRGGKAGK